MSRPHANSYLNTCDDTSEYTPSMNKKDQDDINEEETETVEQGLNPVQKGLQAYEVPNSLFHGVEPGEDDYIPEDINGKMLNKVKLSVTFWMPRSSDLLHFDMHTSNGKVFTDRGGKRKVGRCARHLYGVNKICPKLKTGGDINTSNWQNLGGLKVCFRCSLFAMNHACHTQKKFSTALIQTSLQLGNHTCTCHPARNKCEAKVITGVAKYFNAGPQKVYRSQ